ncbi:MAG: ExbD/TolR family protein [Paracoccaceae bacterium]
MGGFDFGDAGRRRRPNLTPMIDVVFLLLVFFMLVARFDPDRALAVSAAAGGGGAWAGAPRLVTVAPDSLRLNGVATDPARLGGELTLLMPDPGAPVVVRPVDGASLQRLVAVLDTLSAASIRRIVIAE